MVEGRLVVVVPPKALELLEDVEVREVVVELLDEGSVDGGVGGAVSPSVAIPSPGDA